MKILVLSSEVWNDTINGNNVTSNWFEGMDAEFANLYCSPGIPDNKCCDTYFQVTDSMMFKSIFFRKKAGKRLDRNNDRGKKSHRKGGDDANNNQRINDDAEEEPKKLYSFLKSISGDFLRWIRELIWLWGKYDVRQMKEFIEDFRPEIVFTERMASCKMLRLEKTVSELSDAPMVAFTGDDEYSLRQFKLSPFFWINRFMIRCRLREMVKKYKIYYTLSYEQLLDYKKLFGCDMRILQKCGELEDEKNTENEINHPIEIIYAGKLYMNRWKALADISDCLKKINIDSVRMVLKIYTKDKTTKKQKNLLNDKINSFIMPPVSQDELKEVYKRANIALHVESQNLSQRLATRLSFSTKIIDCLFSGCAVLAYCWKEQSGWTYLKREDAAICVDNKKDLYISLKRIAEDEDMISKYAAKAKECCRRNHQKKIVQKSLLADFEELIRKTA